MWIERLFQALLWGVFLAAIAMLNRGVSTFWLMVGLATWALLSVVSLVARAIDVRRTIRVLRRLDPERRRAIVKNIRPFAARTYYDQELRTDGDPDVSGAVERYAFSPRDRRDQTLLYWMLVLTALGVLVAEVIAKSPTRVERLVGLGVVATCVASLAMVQRKAKRLDTILEVSPFGITEIQPNGTRRWLNWERSLQIRANRSRGRVELSPTGASPGEFIALDFDRVGFDRLLQLVLDYGGFRPKPDGSPKPDAVPDRAVVVPAPPWAGVTAAMLHRLALRSWPVAVAAVVAYRIVRPAPRVTHFDQFALTPSAITPARLTYAATLHGRFWSAETDSIVMTVHACGNAAWCLASGAESLTVARTDLHPMAARIRGISVTWSPDSVRSTYEDFDGRHFHFEAPNRGFALPNTQLLDLLFASAPLHGAVVPLQRIEHVQMDGEDLGGGLNGESAEIVGLLRSDTMVVETTGPVTDTIILGDRRVPYHGVELTVHYPDRVDRLWVMDSTHYIARREVRFRNAQAGTRLDALVSVR